MFFPVGHEGDVTIRRWPIVTGAIVFISLVVFLLTNSAIHKDNGQLVSIRAHILILNARFPELPMSDKARAMVEKFKEKNPDVYRQLASVNRDPFDMWDAQLMMNPDWKMDELAAEMEDLCKKWEEVPKELFLWNYAYHSDRPTPWSYITSAFLHEGWLHLIFNMWFLYLVGVLLENAWGHILYTLFYLAAAAASAFGNGLANPDSPVSMIGASGAIAGLMGAFMVRFPTQRLRVACFLFYRLRLFFFSMPAWVFLLLWVVGEVAYGALALGDHVAHWAHVSGFVFGAMVGGALRLMPVEKMVNPEDPSQTWEPDPEILDAMDLLNQRQPEEAKAVLENYLATHSNSIDAHELMLKVGAWKGDQEGERATLTTLAGLQLAKGDSEAAWHCYEQFLQLSGTGFPSTTMMPLIRHLERHEKYERAAQEYERVAQQHPDERVFVDATMSAARIYLNKLNSPAKAEALYRAAASSPVPHLDAELLIQEGLKQCMAHAARGANA